MTPRDTSSAPAGDDSSGPFIPGANATAFNILPDLSVRIFPVRIVGKSVGRDLYWVIGPGDRYIRAAVRHEIQGLTPEAAARAVALSAPGRAYRCYPPIASTTRPAAKPSGNPDAQ